MTRLTDFFQQSSGNKLLYISSEHCYHPQRHGISFVDLQYIDYTVLKSATLYFFDSTLDPKNPTVIEALEDNKILDQLGDGDFIWVKQSHYGLENGTLYYLNAGNGDKKDRLCRISHRRHNESQAGVFSVTRDRLMHATSVTRPRKIAMPNGNPCGVSSCPLTADDINAIIAISHANLFAACCQSAASKNEAKSFLNKLLDHLQEIDDQKNVLLSQHVLGQAFQIDNYDCDFGQSSEKVYDNIIQLSTYLCQSALAFKEYHDLYRDHLKVLAISGLGFVAMLLMFQFAVLPSLAFFSGEVVSLVCGLTLCCFFCKIVGFLVGRSDCYKAIKDYQNLAKQYLSTAFPQTQSLTDSNLEKAKNLLEAMTNESQDKIIERVVDSQQHGCQLFHPNGSVPPKAGVKVGVWSQDASCCLGGSTEYQQFQ